MDARIYTPGEALAHSGLPRTTFYRLVKRGIAQPEGDGFYTQAAINALVEAHRPRGQANGRLPPTPRDGWRRVADSPSLAYSGEAGWSLLRPGDDEGDFYLELLLYRTGASRPLHGDGTFYTWRSAHSRRKALPWFQAAGEAWADRKGDDHLLNASALLDAINATKPAWELSPKP